MLRLGVKGKLLLLVFVVLIPLIILQTVRIKGLFDRGVQNDLAMSEELGKAIATSFSNYVTETWNQEEVIASFITLHSDIAVQEIQEYLMEVDESQELLFNLSWISPDGTVLASSRKELTGMNFKHREYVQWVIHGKERVISDLTLSAIDNRPVILIVFGIRKDNLLLGMVSAVVDAEKLYQRMPEVSMFSASSYGLIDRNGMLVYHSSKQDIAYSQRIIYRDIQQVNMLEGDLVNELYGASNDGDMHTCVVHPIDDLGWHSFVDTNYESVLSKHHKDLLKDIIMLGVISTLSFLFAYFLGKMLLKPIGSIERTIKAIKKGDFSARSNISGYDELAVTAQAIDSMAESIEQYDSLKSQAFTNLSHELKTPLNVIFASTQLIERLGVIQGACPNHCKIEKQVGVIKQNAYRLIRIINNLIDITKYESGYLAVCMGNYDIVNILEEITLSVARLAEIKGLELVFDTDCEEKIMACDPDMMERIMLNLLSNAMKFTDKGGSITVSFFDKGSKVEFSVKDTGIGIPLDKQGIIFDRFGQVDTSLTRNFEGSGIGLSLVKSLVEMHHGSIRVVSEPGKGAEFIITLPANQLPDETEISSRTNKRSLEESINIEFSDLKDIYKA